LKVAILSDIHGNLEGLEAALADIAANGITRIWCLGDVVGYGASPNECTERVRGFAEACVLGNHDEVCLGRGRIEYFNSVARMAAMWTQGVMSPATREYLEASPMTVPLEVNSTKGLLVHASPYFPEDWHYILSEHDAMAAFGSCSDPLIFVGHSHVPGIFLEADGQVTHHRALTFQMQPGVRCLVNVGSVGQPRDGDPRAAWCLVDTDEHSVTVRRVAYDVELAQRKIREAGLPEILASRLSWGE